MTTTTTTAPSAAITWWLNRSRSGIATVSWITREGEHKHITGQIAGWATTDNGNPYLIVETRQAHGTGSDRTRISSAALARSLKAAGIQYKPQPRDTAPRCKDCGGWLTRFDIEAAAAPGYHFDCA